MTSRPKMLPLLAQRAYFALLVIAVLWFVFYRTTWVGRSANTGTFGLSARVAPMWSPPKPISDRIPPNVVRIPFWPRWRAAIVPDWSIILLKLATAVILVSLSFGTLARRVWKPGVSYWLDFAWYSGLCQCVAALVFLMVSAPLYLIVDVFVGVFAVVVVLGGALAGHRFTRLEWQRRAEWGYVAKRNRADVAVRQKADLEDELRQDVSRAAIPATMPRGVQSYSRVIGGVALGLFSSVALMLLSVMIGKFCYDRGLLENSEPFFIRRIIGTILALCAVCCVVVWLFRNQTDLVKGAILGLSAGCLFWSVLMFILH